MKFNDYPQLWWEVKHMDPPKPQTRQAMNLTMSIK